MTPVIALLDGVGGPEILVIGMVALLMFGSKRLPELGRAFGRAVREFKRATSGVEDSLREVMREPPSKPIVRPAAKHVPARHNPVPSATALKPEPKATIGADETPPTTPEPDRPQQPNLQEPAPAESDDDPYAPDRTAGGSAASEAKPPA